jgi:hypothetical protein
MTEQEKTDRAMIERVWREHHGYGPEHQLAASDREWWFFISLLNARDLAK